MTMTDDLVGWLEAATEGSRELDLEILQAISGKPWRWVPSVVMDAITWDEYGPGAVGNPVCSLDEFTASVDAALSLVPEGFDASVYVSAASPPMGRHCGAVVRQPCDSGSKKDRGEICATAHGKPSPALALCIACLRARNLQGEAAKGEG